jgi:signal transduction histidine kinase
MRHGSWGWSMTDPSRSPNILMATIGVGLLAALIFVLTGRSDDAVLTVRFENARLCIEPAIQVPFNRRGLYQLLAKPAQRSPECWRSIDLPHAWRPVGAKPIRDELEFLQRALYVVRYPVPQSWEPGESLLIYCPKLMGSAWQLRVNGRPILDNLDDWRMTWNRPLVARVPAEQLHPGQSIEVTIAVAFEPKTGYALARVSGGPASSMVRTVAMRQYLQVNVPFASIIMLATMSVFFFLFWLTRRSEQSYLLLAFSCIAWGVCNLHYVLPAPDDRLREAWYRAVITASVPWMIWLVYLFVLHVDQRFRRVFARAMPVYVVIMTAIALPVFSLGPDVGLFFHSLSTIVSGLVTGRVCWLAIRGGSLELRMIAAALLIATAAGAHDVAMLAQATDPEGINLLPCSSLLLFGALLFSVHRRYVHALNEHENLTSTLAQRLAARERELQENHARLLELERARTLTCERQRLMRDMHDGVGSALTTSLAMLQQDRPDTAELTNILRESVDDLRAVIDSLEPADGDLVTLLATLRFRLGKRLENAGILLDWSMCDLPPLNWLGPSPALQIVRIVQGALTNVIKHAGASRIQMSAHQEDSWIVVRVVDNGCGFAVGAVPASNGRGLRNLKHRAAGLNAQLFIESRPGTGTTVSLLLPVAM